MKWLMLALGLGCSVVQASVVYDLPPGSVWAQMDSCSITAPVLDVLFAAAHEHAPEVTRDQVLVAAIQNRVLAAYARSHFPADELFPGDRVAYPKRVQLEYAYEATLRAGFGAQLQAAMHALPHHNLSSLVLRAYSLTVGQRQDLFPHGHLLLDFKLGPHQLEQAKSIPLLDYRLPSGVQGRITVADVFARQNMQGRMAIYNGDDVFLKKQALDLLSTQFIFDWVSHQGPLTSAEQAVLHQAIVDKPDADALRAIMGTIPGEHEGSAYLAQLASKVTEAQVRSFYRSHRDMFKRVDRVHALHIRVDDEQKALALEKQLDAGADFATLAKKYSQAADAGRGGDLGWIVHDTSGHTDWLSSVAFIHKPGEPVRAMRVPGPALGASRWELVKVIGREEGYQAEDSSDVRFEASQIIAIQQAQAQFKSILHDLLAKQTIHLQKSLVGKGLDL